MKPSEEDLKSSRKLVLLNSPRKSSRRWKTITMKDKPWILLLFKKPGREVLKKNTKRKLKKSWPHFLTNRRWKRFLGMNSKKISTFLKISFRNKSEEWKENFNMREKDMKKIVIQTKNKTVSTQKRCMKKARVRMKAMRWKNKEIKSILKKLINSSSMRKKERSRKTSG